MTKTKEYEIECYDQFHKLAMSDDPQEAVAGRFCKEFLQPFDNFEQRECKRNTPVAALALGQIHAALMLVCGTAFALAKEGREEAVAKQIQEMCERIVQWHLETAKESRKKESTK